MSKIIFTESERDQIFDCLPKTDAQKAYWDDLKSYAEVSRLWADMRVGKKKPAAIAAYRSIKKLQDATKSMGKSFYALTKAHQDDGYAPFPWSEAVTEIENIRSAIYNLASMHKVYAFYFVVDGRDKTFEKGLIGVALALWCRHFPDDPLPNDPRQGRLGRKGHEECRPLRLCGIVLKAATGKPQKDIRRLYLSVLAGWKTTGVPLFHPPAPGELTSEQLVALIDLCFPSTQGESPKEQFKRTLSLFCPNPPPKND